jgi:hypothetical protein
VLLRRVAGANGRLRQPIPFARWLLAPWPTWLQWRRMVLWQIGSCRAALDTEREIRYAVTLLRARYGPRWKREAPAELVWMLRMGAFIDTARHAPVLRRLHSAPPGRLDLAHPWLWARPPRRSVTTLRW